MYTLVNIEYHEDSTRYDLLLTRQDGYEVQLQGVTMESVHDLLEHDAKTHDMTTYFINTLGVGATLYWVLANRIDKPYRIEPFHPLRDTIESLTT